MATANTIAGESYSIRASPYAAARANSSGSASRRARSVRDVVMAKRAAVDLQSLAMDPLVLFPGGISVLLRAVGSLTRASFATLLKFRGHASLVFVLLCLVLMVGHPAGERSQICTFTQPLQRYCQYHLDFAETVHQFIVQ